MLIDIGKAHLYGPMEIDEFVELPDERAAPGKCAKLKHTLYDTRIASSSWEKEYSRSLAELGLAKGVASPVASVKRLGSESLCMRAISSCLVVSGTCGRFTTPWRRNTLSRGVADWGPTSAIPRSSWC